MIAIIKDKKSYPYASIIRECRLAAGLTQQEFADCIGYTKQMIIHWESKRANPHYSIIGIIRSRFPLFVEYEKKCDGLKMFKNDFTDSIRTFRIYKNYMNRVEFAKAIQVRYNTVHDWERGRSIPIYKHVEAIIKAFPDFEEKAGGKV